MAAVAGFTWRDTDPGGEQPQVRLDELRAGGDPALDGRLLAYNEDEARATLVLRAYLADAAR